MKATNRIILIILSFVLLNCSLSFTVQAAAVPLVTQVATVNVSSLRLRTGPSTDHSTIMSAPLGDYVLITGKSGDWYHVSYNLKSGYMHSDYLNTYTAKNVELGYGMVTGDTVNVRSGPGISYRSISKAINGDRAYIIGFNQQWYKVIHRNLIGYIRSDYLKLTQIPYENHNSVNKPIFFVNGKSTGIQPSASALTNLNLSDKRNQIVAEAKKYLGTPYLWGGDTTKGFDCSGFVQYVFKRCGITISRTTEQQALVGTSIKKASLRPGDLVFLQNTYRAGISHVGIYIGENQMIHASSSKGVTISDLSNSYYTEHYHSARNIFS